MFHLEYVVYALLVWNLLVLLLYGMDKAKAKRNKRRISESLLLATAFFMGGVGALFGMLIFMSCPYHGLHFSGIIN